MTLRVSVDQDVCIGSGNCVQLAPEAFQLDDIEGVSVVTNANAASLEQLRRAERTCPTGAILVQGSEDGELQH